MNKGVLGIWGKFYKIAFIIATVICLLNIGIAGVDYYNLTQKINANHHNVESECLFDGVDKSLDCNSVSSSVESTIAFNDKNYQ